MVTTETLEFFFKLLYRESGLMLDESKRYLIESRLEPVAIQEGFESIDELASHISRAKNPALNQKIVDAMATNETSFFRDVASFNVFKEVVVPELMKVNQATRKIRIWSAACSTGQEPYTLAIALNEMGPALKGWDVEIIATDISESVLKQAKQGIYSQHEVQRGLSTHQLLRNFTQEGLVWKVKPEIKKRIHFDRLNLLAQFSNIGKFDIVFCRNILIYFDLKTKEDVINRITDVLPPDGILFLGGAEALLGINSSLVRIDSKKVIYYQKKKHSCDDHVQEETDEIKRRRVCRI